MPRDIESVLKIILDLDVADRPECQPCLDVLYQYIDVELDGEDADRLFPEVTEHLSDCRECKKEYEDLKAVLSIERVGSSEPSPDFAESGQRFPTILRPTRSLLEESPIDQPPQIALPQGVVIPIRIGKEKAEMEQVQSLPLPSPAPGVSLTLLIGPVTESKVTFEVKTTPSSGKQIEDLIISISEAQGIVSMGERAWGEERTIYSLPRSNEYLVHIRYEDKVAVSRLALVLEDETSLKER